MKMKLLSWEWKSRRKLKKNVGDKFDYLPRFLLKSPSY